MLLDNKKDHRIIITMTLLVGVLTLGHYVNNSFLIMATLIAIMGITFVIPTESYLPVTLFLLTWSGVMRVSANSISWYTIIQTIYIIVFLMKAGKNKRMTLRKETIIAIFILVLTSITAILIHDYDISLGYINFMLMLAFVPLYTTHERGTSFKVSGIYYVLGTVTASFAGLLFLKTGHMTEFISVSEHINIGVNRISGLSGDSNGYAAELLAAIGICFVLLSRENAFINKIMYGTMIAIAIFFGFMTVSKSFLILVLLLSTVWVFYCIFCSNMKHKIALIVIISVAISVLLTLPQTQDFLSMYYTRFTDRSTANDFSSGRFEIWKNYFYAIMDNGAVLLFGNGFIRSAVVPVSGVGMAAHNTAIQIIFQAGLVGTVALLIWLSSMRFKPVGNSFKQFEKVYMALMLFLPWLALDKLFFDDFFFFIMLYQTMLMEDKDDSVKVVRGGRDEY